jgi:hypothetical protein
MAIVKKGGHMPHQTTTAVRNMVSPAALTTGGSLEAKSNQGSLEASFPASPLFTAVYNADEVKKYMYKLLTNTVMTAPIVDGVGADVAAAAGYWGFQSPGPATEASPSSTDLSYAGAPIIDGVTEVGADKASPYMPNLHVPPIDAPTSEVDTQNVLPNASSPPYVGNGLATPANTSAATKNNLVEPHKNGNIPTPNGPTFEGAAGGGSFKVPQK